uniref:Aquaporin n=1 Tax=Plectus sambesii TaxID=2011161 RepID=A0A914V1V0_9BILA
MEPLYVSLSFYVSVFILAEITRRVIETLTGPGTLSRRFAYELIATAQMCTCVYENALIIKYYGLIGFFTVVVVLLIVGSYVNRGAFVSPLASIEAVYFGRISIRDFVALFLAELAGGYMAFRWARLIWSAGVSHDHTAFYDNFYCKLGYKVPYVQAAVFEVVGCFLIRYIIGAAPLATKRFVAAITAAGFLTFALRFIGVPGLNPIVASSRMQGCEGLSIDWFLFTYWICPIIGSLAAAIYQSRGQAPAVKKTPAAVKKSAAAVKKTN